MKPILIVPSRNRNAILCLIVAAAGLLAAVFVLRQPSETNAALLFGYSAFRLALAGGLLHDICKGQPRHEAAAGEFLRRLELPEMARLVQDHRDLSLPDDEPVTERELVYLADKYCHGGNFVPVQRRFDLKLEAYAQDAPACEAIWGRLVRVKKLEERIAREIGREPALVAEHALVRNCNAARGTAAQSNVA